MAKFQLQYEINKLFDVKDDGTIDTSKNYARYIQNNFDTILKYVNDCISEINLTVGSAIMVIKKAGIFKDGDILMTSLVVPRGRKVIFQYSFDSIYKFNDSDVIHTYTQGQSPHFIIVENITSLPAGIDKDFIAKYWTIGINNGTWYNPALSWTNFSARTFATKSIFTEGTYTDLKFYCRDFKHETQAQKMQENTYFGFWASYEVGA